MSTLLMTSWSSSQRQTQRRRKVSTRVRTLCQAAAVSCSSCAPAALASEKKEWLCHNPEQRQDSARQEEQLCE
jgi:hypothetical protein